MKKTNTPLYSPVVLTTLFTLIRLWLLIPILLYGNQMANNNDINSILDSLLFTQQNNYQYKDSMQKTMSFENYEETPYLDSSGFPTIGIGNLLEKKSYKTLPDKYSNIKKDFNSDFSNERFMLFDEKESDFSDLLNFINHKTLDFSL